MTLQSRSFKVGTLGTHLVLPIAISYPEVFSWISLMVRHLFPFKGDFSLGKARSHRAPNLGCRGSESPGWFDVSPKNCTRCDAWAGVLSWWSCQSPVAHSCSLLNHVDSFHRGMFKLNTQFDADSLLYLLSHFECDSHTVHMLTQWDLPPHWLVQWSHHCWHMCIQSIHLGCQVTSMWRKLFLLY